MQGLPGVVLLLVLVLALLLVLVLALLLVPVLLVGLWSGQLLRVNNNSNMVSLCVVIGLLFVPTGRRAYLEQHRKLCKQ